MNKKKIVWFLISVGMFFGGLIFILQGMPRLNEQSPPKKITVQTEKVTLLEPLLVKWVMDKSSRISHEQAKEIVTHCVKTKIPLFILAVISVESEFNPSAVSSKGAIGLGQIMFKHHGQNLIKAEIIKEERDLFNIDCNIKAIKFILEMYFTQSHGDVGKSLEKYLGGQNGQYQKRILLNFANLYILTTKGEKI